MKHRNLNTLVFGRLTVISELPRSRGGPLKWKCKCLCGNEIEAFGANLSRGHTQSCGCLQRERTSAANSTHRKARTPLHYVWITMRQRCSNPNNKAFRRYGGRGITVCRRWKSFENFREDMGECPKGFSLERKNNDKGYSPKNCKWASREEQMRNRSNSVKVGFNGVFKCVSQWASELKISDKSIYRRLKEGKTGAAALFGYSDRKRKLNQVKALAL